MTLLLVLAAALVWAGTAGAQLKGTDVSHYNGTVDWLRVSNAGYSFAFVKATEGLTITDPTYPINRDGAATIGIRTGAYHFARPGGAGDAAIVANAVAQADRYVDVAGLRPGDLPPALDLETTGGLAPAALTEWTQAWLDEVTARTGTKAVVYFSPNFWKRSLADTATFAQQGYRLWIAHWKVSAPAVPAGDWAGAGWTFWQWTNCETIPGFLRCVDGDRFAGTSLASVAVPSFPAAAPSATATPTVVGAAQVGRLVAAKAGAWDGGRPISFAYQWQSCDAAGGGCVAIPGATAESYTPSAADAGHALVVSVTAQNASGATTAFSAPTLAVATGGVAGAGAPAATAPPAIAGTAQVGQALSASVGTWSGSPTIFALQWRRCDPAGANCAAISGATAPTYTLSPGDVGATISLLVTATGKGGSRSAGSAPTAVVAAAPVPPAVVGSAVAQAGAAGAVTTTGGAVTATWQPGAVPVGATVSLATRSPKLTLPGTGFALGVTAPLAWPVDVRYAAAPADAVAGLASGRTWQALPQLTTAALAAGQSAGIYRDATGALHVLTRVAGTFALFAPGKWGDPSRVAAGRPLLKRVAPLRIRGRADGSLLVTTRVTVASQAHLYASLGGVPIVQQGSRLGWWLHGRTAKTVQALQRTPGGFPLRLRVSARRLRRGTTYHLRLAAVDPYGRKASLTIKVRRR